MKFTFFSIIFLAFSTISFCRNEQKCFNFVNGTNIDSDSSINIFLQKFVQSFNNKDSFFIEKNLISQTDYDSIVYFLKGYKVSCLTQFEEEYKVSGIFSEYYNSILNNRKIDSIALISSNSLFGCGGISFTRINAKAFFKLKNGIYDSAITFVFIEDINKKYRLLSQIFFSKTINYE